MSSEPASPPNASPDDIDRWEGLLDRLAERKKAHEEKEAEQAIQPPSNWRIALDNTIWNFTLLARYLRPRLRKKIKAGILALRTRVWPYTRLTLQRTWALLKYIYLQSWQITKRVGLYLHGWILWQQRLMRLNPDRKLAVIGLVGGFTIPLALIIIISSLMPQPVAPAPSALQLDPSVPAPVADFAENVVEEDDATTSQQAETSTDALSPQNFTFEQFVTRDNTGRLHLLSQQAQKQILSWYPYGTPATRVMQFFGETIKRTSEDEDDPTLAARKRCLSLPVNRVFTQKTVTCTYGHKPPEPKRPRESDQLRVFWIMALSYDRQGKLVDLKLHARTTMAAH